jgi:hypothetical protein
VGDRLREFGGGMRRFKQQLDFKKISIEAYLDVETMLLVKNIKWQRGKQKRLSKRLDLTFKAYDKYIACWDKRWRK